MVEPIIQNNQLIHNQTLIDIINTREHSLIPVYIRYKDTVYTLPEINSFKYDYTFGKFTVGFCGILSMLYRNHFDIRLTQHLFDPEYTIWESYDSVMAITTPYITLELSHVDMDFIPEQYKPAMEYTNHIISAIESYINND